MFYTKIKPLGHKLGPRSDLWKRGRDPQNIFWLLKNTDKNNNCIKALRYKGITYSEDDDILNVASKFYTELYTGKTQGVDAINEYLDKVN